MRDGEGTLKPINRAIFAISVVLLGYFVLLLALGPYAYQIALQDRGRPLYVGRVSFYLFSLIPMEIRTPLFPAEYSFYILLLLYLFFLLKTLSDGANFAKVAKEGDPLLNSYVGTVVLTGAVLSLVIVMTIILEETGVQVGGLKFEDKAVEYLEITYAPIKEEIGFRMTFIGAFSALAYAILGGRGMFNMVRGIVYPRRLLEGLSADGRRLLTISVWVLVILSSLIFGTAHVLFPSGWMLGKVFTATLSGAALGYLYVRYGLPSAITSHWIFNYVVETADILSETAYVVSIGVKILIFAGFLSLLYIVSRGLMRLLG